MNDCPQTQPPSFDAAVKSYERAIGGKIQMLMVHKKGIAELRSKQASFRTIANLLKHSGIDVSHDTVARFCQENLKPMPRKKALARTPVQIPKPVVVSLLQAQRETIATPGVRVRGPRIADPKNV